MFSGLCFCVHGSGFYDREQKLCRLANAPLLLGFESHPALGLTNRCRTSTPTHELSRADLSNYPGAENQLGPVKLPINGRSGEVPAVVMRL